jgi:iron-sulfur cluster assembly accessory protein
VVENGSTTPATGVTNSSVSSVQDLGYDAGVATVETLVELTPRAAEKIRELQATEPVGEAEVLRVAIQGGGCSGFQYGLGFDRGALEGDHELELHGVRVVVDPFSAPYLTGSTIDWLDGLAESGFKIDNPQAVSSCGCGHSFQVEDEAAADAQAGGCGSGCG